ncbi:hypothetical protein [Nonomuraea aurantiaca]|uniref:hypothetical protein n=1 Tax=Nonomuraea aurantiaca TaxID=2878562 RepID=UPI001CDA05D6|nr:hypothetical protein [Nonomuraea aurantiaca]MCA2221701.1 hypothetical protein [Nonomuraea aurantiaca]
MAFWSRLFKWGAGDPLAEREEARRQGMRDAREHPLGEFTDPEFQPSYVTEVRALARERITEVDRRLAATRTALLERAVGARETILRELGRADLRPVGGSSNGTGSGVEGAGSAGDSGVASAHASAGGEDAFISIAEARRRRGEARRRAVLQEASDTVHRARAQIERLTQEWESALIERNHAVETVHARAEQLIAAYRGGVMRAHPRKEEIPSLWKGEVIAMDSSGDSAAAVSGREEIGRIMEEVEARIEVWHAEVTPRALPGEALRSLPKDAAPDTDASGPSPVTDAEPDPEAGSDRDQTGTGGER